MKRIQLNRVHKNQTGKKIYVKVDNDDYDWLNQWNWSLSSHRARNRRTQYAFRTEKGKCIWMHRLILGLSSKDKLITDHINRNGLDNRRINLRKCTPSENIKNKTSHGTSKYLGVSLQIRKYKSRKSGKVKIMKNWIAHIKAGGTYKYLSYFPHTKNGERAAARIYNEAAKKHHGEFANLNIIT